jgi:hypothetical protein
MTLPKLILGTFVLYSGIAIPQEVEIRCNETHCAISKDDLRLIVQYVKQLERECSGKSI